MVLQIKYAVFGVLVFCGPLYLLSLIHFLRHYSMCSLFMSAIFFFLRMSEPNRMGKLTTLIFSVNQKFFCKYLMVTRRNCHFFWHCQLYCLDYSKFQLQKLIVEYTDTATALLYEILLVFQQVRYIFLSYILYCMIVIRII